MGDCRPDALRKRSELHAAGRDPAAILAPVSVTMKLRILLTGANNQVGWEFASLAPLYKDCLMRLDAALDHPAYNYILRTGRIDKQRALPPPHRDHAQPWRSARPRVGQRRSHL